jgi:hypothetical protein
MTSGGLVTQFSVRLRVFGFGGNASPLRSSLLRESFERTLDPIETFLELPGSQGGVRRASREARIATPPVQTDLFGLIDGADKEPHLNRQQLDIREIDFDIAGDDQALVKDAVENVYQAVRARWINELGQSAILVSRVLLGRDERASELARPSRH